MFGTAELAPTSQVGTRSNLVSCGRVSMTSITSLAASAGRCLAVPEAGFPEMGFSADELFMVGLFVEVLAAAPAEVANTCLAFAWLFNACTSTGVATGSCAPLAIASADEVSDVLLGTDLCPGSTGDCRAMLAFRDIIATVALGVAAEDFTVAARLVGAMVWIAAAGV